MEMQAGLMAALMMTHAARSIMSMTMVGVLFSRIDRILLHIVVAMKAGGRKIASTVTVRVMFCGTGDSMRVGRRLAVGGEIGTRWHQTRFRLLVIRRDSKASLMVRPMISKALS